MRRVLETGPTAIRMFRRFAPYHEIPDAVERRLAIVTLHSEGWNTKSIAGYLKTSRPTVYRALKRWIAEGVYGLEDRPRGAKRKADLRVMNEVRKLQQNPELGEFRVSAALELLGIYLSPRTCGRILAVNRELYGLKKPKRGAKEKREMPFQSSRGTRSGAWTSATWTTTCRRASCRKGARSTPSPYSRTTVGPSWRAPSPRART